MKITKEEIDAVKFSVTRLMYLHEQIKKAADDSCIDFIHPDWLEMPYINSFKGIEMVRAAFDMPEEAYEIEYTDSGTMFIYLKLLNLKLRCILLPHDPCYVPQEESKSTAKMMIEKLEESKDA